MGREETTLPAVLDLDRILITAAGRATLLDFPSSGLQRVSGVPESQAEPSGPLDAATFFKRLAIVALKGQIPSDQFKSLRTHRRLGCQRLRIVDAAAEFRGPEIEIVRGVVQFMQAGQFDFALPAR